MFWSPQVAFFSPNCRAFWKEARVLSPPWLTTAGAVLADVWLPDVSMPVVDSLGEQFLDYVEDGMTVTVKPDGVVEVA